MYMFIWRKLTRNFPYELTRDEGYASEKRDQIFWNPNKATPFVLTPSIFQVEYHVTQRETKESKLRRFVYTGRSIQLSKEGKSTFLFKNVLKDKIIV